MNQKQKQVAWQKLDLYLGRVTDENGAIQSEPPSSPEGEAQAAAFCISAEELWYLRLACCKSGGIKNRTFNRDWAVYEAFSIFRLRGAGKMEARKRLAKYFKVSESRIRDGLKRFADMEKEYGACPVFDITAKTKLPPKNLFQNPD